MANFVVATIHHILSSRLFVPHYSEILVSGLGVVVTFIEAYGANAYFAAGKVYRDTHPKLTILQPPRQSHAIVHHAMSLLRVVHSLSLSSSEIQLVQRYFVYLFYYFNIFRIKYEIPLYQLNLGVWQRQWINYRQQWHYKIHYCMGLIRGLYSCKPRAHSYIRFLHCKIDISHTQIYEQDYNP